MRAQRRRSQLAGVGEGRMRSQRRMRYRRSGRGARRGCSNPKLSQRLFREITFETAQKPDCPCMVSECDVRSAGLNIQRGAETGFRFCGKTDPAFASLGFPGPMRCFALSPGSHSALLDHLQRSLRDLRERRDRLGAGGVSLLGLNEHRELRGDVHVGLLHGTAHDRATVASAC